MKRETREQMGGFFTAFFTTLLLMGVVLCVVYLVFDSRSGGDPGTHVADPNTYLPQAEDRMNLLLAGRENANEQPDLFLLLGFLPDRGKVAVCMLPPGTYVADQGRDSTLGQLYEKGGVRYAQKVLAEYLDIPIHRYAQGEMDTLDRLLTGQGLMDFYLPVDLSFTLRGREVNMPKGDYQLDGRKAADILTCNNYPGGEIERSDRGGMLFSQLIQEMLPAFLTDSGEQLAGSLMTWLETDVSFADYEQRRQALEFLAALELPATTTVFLEGAQGDGGSLVLSGPCIQRIGETYGLPQTAPIREDEPPVSESRTGSFVKEFF